jgi:Ca2+-binding EF-hand superfamily protein
MASTTTPSRLANHSTPTTDADTWTPRGLVRERESSPTRGANDSPGFGGMLATSRAGSTDNNSLSKLQPAQVRELREGFQILDRDSDGHVGREDVADMLTQLGDSYLAPISGLLLTNEGMSANPTDLTAFFPPSTPQTVTLPAYLNSLASLLASLSPSSELLSAFSAFDEDDSGQIDLGELRDALLHTAPEPGVHALSERDIDQVMNGFTGRRAFGKQTAGALGKRGEVFKYQEFVSNIQGGASRENNENE